VQELKKRDSKPVDPSRVNGLAIPVAEGVIEVMMATAAMAYDRDRLDDALNLYRGVALARPKWSRPRVGEGAVLYRMRDVAGAEAAYRAALALNPKDHEAHLYFGELAWQALGDIQQAKQHLNETYRLDPKGPHGARAQVMLQLIARQEAREAAKT
jgi:tetratricopeptide (TPR) repeat protein